MEPTPSVEIYRLEECRDKALASMEAGSSHGLSLRIDHGSHYLSDHFQKQTRAGGMDASFIFLEQPQAGGVVERLFCALKEQVIYGRVYENLEEVRQAVSEFVGLYNNQWLIEKNGYLSPVNARRAYYESEAVYMKKPDIIVSLYRNPRSRALRARQIRMSSSETLRVNRVKIKPRTRNSG